MKRGRWAVMALAAVVIAVAVITGYQPEQDPMPSISSPKHSSRTQRTEGMDSMNLEELPTYDYRQQEIELYNQNQRIYGIAYIPETDREYRL